MIHLSCRECIRRLIVIKDPLLSEDSMGEIAVFVKSAASSSTIDFCSLVDEAAIQLRKEVPQELVVRMFQKMVGDSPFSHYGHD